MEKLDELLYSVSYAEENPISAMIELTCKCNWKCEHCYVEQSKNDVYDIGNLTKILKILRFNGIYEIVYIGGEIFMRKDIMEIIHLTRSMKFDVILESNASLLNEKIVNQLAEEKIKKFSCSLYSMNDEIHKSISNEKKGISSLINNLLTLKKYNIPVQVKIPLMKKNYDYFEEVVTFCEENDFEVKINSCMFPKISGENVDNLNLSVQELSKKINMIDRINTSEFVEHRNENLYVCTAPRISLFLDYMGNAYPCINYRNCMGNIFIDDFNDIWNSKIRKEIVSLKAKDMAKCVECDAFNQCVICPGINYMYTNNICIPSDNCCTTAFARKSGNLL